MAGISVKEFKQNLKELIVKYGYNSNQVKEYQNENLKLSNYYTVFRVNEVVVGELKKEKQFKL